MNSFPSPFLRALKDDKYSKGESDFSCTQILGPPQRTWLATMHERDESPYGSFMALLGTAVHNILEEYCHEDEGEMAEERYFIKVQGHVLSGQLDFYENKTVFDYKVYGGEIEEAKPDHILQVQVNGRLAELNGIEVHSVAIVYVLRDWSYMRSRVNPKYAQTPFKIFVFPYNGELAEKTIQERVALHIEAIKGSPHLCTADEQWRKPDTWAVKKPDAKRASRVYESLEEAESNLKAGQIIETRKGEAVFCRFFCGFAAHCPQHIRETNEQ